MIPELTVEERFNVVVNQAFGGWHHVSSRKPCGKGVSFCVYAEISTYDFAQLTKLVIACHVVRVRAEIAQGGPRMLKIYMHPRENKPESWSQHHPDGADLTMAQAGRDAFAAYQATLPPPPKLTRSQIRYRRFLSADCGMKFSEWLKWETWSNRRAES